MAAGKAIVACRGAAHGLSPGENGLVVDDDDVVNFSDAVLQLTEDSGLRTALGNAARDAVLKRHSHDAIAVAIEGVYERVARTS